LKIGRDAVVRFDYTLRNDRGEVIDSSDGREPLAYIQGHGHIVPGLEAAMEGKQQGDRFEVRIPPAEGYGEHEEDAVFEIPRSRLPKGVEPKVGMEVASRTPDGHTMRFHLTEVGPDKVKADANHPLAGQHLNFKVAVVDVRAATGDELDHGHVHGPGGAH